MARDLPVVLSQVNLAESLALEIDTLPAELDASGARSCRVYCEQKHAAKMLAATPGYTWRCNSVGRDHIGDR